LSIIACCSIFDKPAIGTTKAETVGAKMNAFHTQPPLKLSMVPLPGSYPRSQLLRCHLLLLKVVTRKTIKIVSQKAIPQIPTPVAQSGYPTVNRVIAQPCGEIAPIKPTAVAEKQYVSGTTIARIAYHLQTTTHPTALNVTISQLLGWPQKAKTVPLLI
jgi:hypothetical protein